MNINICIYIYSIHKYIYIFIYTHTHTVSEGLTAATSLLQYASSRGRVTRHSSFDDFIGSPNGHVNICNMYTRTKRHTQKYTYTQSRATHPWTT